MYLLYFIITTKKSTLTLNLKMQCNENSLFILVFKFWKMLTFKMLSIKMLLLTTGYYFSFTCLNQRSWSGICLNHPSNSGLFLLCVVMIFLCDDRGNPKSKETYCRLLSPWHSKRSSLRDLDDPVCLGNVTFLR